MPSGVYLRRPCMKSYRRLSDLQKERIIQLYQGGFSLRSLAWSFNVSPRTIGRVVKEGKS